MVADTLSRQQINNTTDCSQHSAQSSPTDQIKKVKQPLNSLKNQIIPILDPTKEAIDSKTTFPGRTRHTFYYKNKQDFLTKLQQVAKPNVTTALRKDEELILHFKDDILFHFPNCTFVIAPNLLIHYQLKRTIRINRKNSQTCTPKL